MERNNKNENKEVYCLLTDWVCDGETGSNVEVFATLEAADKEFRAMVEEERKDDHLYDEKDVVEEVSFEGHTFCVYRDGYYCEDHFEMSVVEREIKE